MGFASHASNELVHGSVHSRDLNMNEKWVLMILTTRLTMLYHVTQDVLNTSNYHE
jgi:hypothetical protein